MDPNKDPRALRMETTYLSTPNTGMTPIDPKPNPYADEKACYMNGLINGDQEVIRELIQKGLISDKFATAQELSDNLAARDLQEFKKHRLTDPTLLETLAKDNQKYSKLHKQKPLSVVENTATNVTEENPAQISQKSTIPETAQNYDTEQKARKKAEEKNRQELEKREREQRERERKERERLEREERERETEERLQRQKEERERREREEKEKIEREKYQRLERARNYVSEAKELLDVGDCSGARSKLEESLRCYESNNPERAQAYRWLAEAYCGQDRPDNALINAKRAMSIDSNLEGAINEFIQGKIVKAYTKFGYKEYDKGNYNKAIAHLEKALKLNRLDLEREFIFVAYGKNLLGLEDPVGAAKMFDRALAIGLDEGLENHVRIHLLPKTDPITFFTQKGFRALGNCQFNQAIQYYERALKFNPSPEQTTQIKCKIGNILEKKRKPHKALQWYQSALANGGDEELVESINEFDIPRVNEEIERLQILREQRIETLKQFAKDACTIIALPILLPVAGVYRMGCYVSDEISKFRQQMHHKKKEREIRKQMEKKCAENVERIYRELQAKEQDPDNPTTQAFNRILASCKSVLSASEEADKKADAFIGSNFGYTTEKAKENSEVEEDEDEDEDEELLEEEDWGKLASEIREELFNEDWSNLSFLERRRKLKKI